MSEEADKINSNSEVDFELMVEESQKMRVNIPPWAARHEKLYRMAYYQVKNDDSAAKLPAAKRTIIIRKLMDMYFSKIMENLREEKKGKKANE